MAHFVRSRLHRRIFMWFGATIMLTGVVVGGVMMVTSGSGTSWKAEMTRAHDFAASRFERVWDDAVERDELARSITRDLDLPVKVTDADGATLVEVGTCRGSRSHIAVRRGSIALGEVSLCFERFKAPVGKILFGLFMAFGVVWAASGFIARRLSRPFAELARVAEAIGAGKFETRVRVRKRDHGEAAALAGAINTMAEKIQRQFQDQRELLAAVSHEIRTPLARIRLLLELAREKGVDDESLTEVDREVVEMDVLVAELLASSRLDFSALTPTELDSSEVARRALEREGIVKERLVVEGSGPVVLRADATLVARALANLIGNARAHAGGLTRLRVKLSDTHVAFEAEDLGPGFADGEGERVFEPFYRGKASSSADKESAGKAGSLGLGLSLVRRIAEAHGGRAYAVNAIGGAGAIVGFTIARAPAE